MSVDSDMRVDSVGREQRRIFGPLEEAVDRHATGLPVWILWMEPVEHTTTQYCTADHISYPRQSGQRKKWGGKNVLTNEWTIPLQGSIINAL